MNLARVYAIAFGVVYTLVGLIGFAIAPGLSTGTLIIFPINGPHNVAHLLVGLLGIAAFLLNRNVEYASFMAVLFAVLTVAGFAPQPLLSLIPLGGPTSDYTRRPPSLRPPPAGSIARQGVPHAA